MKLNRCCLVALVLVACLCVESGFGQDRERRGGGGRRSRGRPEPSDVERVAMQELAGKVRGWVVYASGGRVRKVRIGTHESVDLCPGEFARWSPDGKLMAVFDNRTVSVINADGSEPRVLATDGAELADGSPIDFHPDGKRVVYVRRGNGKRGDGLWSVPVDGSGGPTKVPVTGLFTGEPCFSADGTRLATRMGNDLFAIDLTTGRQRKYAHGCSPNVSPDGQWLVNNIGSHKQLQVQSWDGSTSRRLNANVLRPDRTWDDFHWSNHADFITVQGEENREEAYVVQISTGKAYRVSWDGGVRTPDLFVEPTNDGAPRQYDPTHDGSGGGGGGGLNGMVFSSHIFLFYFLPLALALYYAVPRRGKHLMLTVLSYVFYGWANPVFMVLMFFSMAIDWVAGLIISGQFRFGVPEPPALPEGGPRTREQRVALVVSICANLSILVFFKYFNFGVDSFNSLAAAAGLEGMRLDLAFRVVLPLGISFSTFQSMSYAIDVYRGHARAMRSFIDYACFVSMFPQLVAGPIIRFSELDDQLRHRTHTLTKFARGASFVCLGLAKKVLLANPCGKVADMTFGAGSVETLDAWVGAVAYAFQIYFDFSAYSDMAIGLGLMLGFVFPKNFDSPYLSESMTEFWRRWHLSLSTWLRDYLYVPLGGNRRGPSRTYVNLMTVMILGGLWHGASWNFAIWGTIHGGMLVAERARRDRGGLFGFAPRPVRILATFVVVVFAWVFFRADTLDQAVRYCSSMLALSDVHANAALLGGLVGRPYYVLTMLAAAVVVWGCPQVWDWTRTITWPKVAVAVALFWASLAVLFTQAFNPFIYFIF